MALLCDETSGEETILLMHTLVGRSPSCLLRPQSSHVSAEHASISWQRGRWILRDLGSRNGTYLNGERLARGTSRKLSGGDRLAFGEPEVRYHLLSASEPSAFAHVVGSADLHHAEGGSLALPSEEDPKVRLVRGSAGRWWLEQGGRTRPVEDKEIVVIEGQAWTLRIPVPTAPTDELREAAAAELKLRFRVSLDEETVEVLAETPEGVLALPPRAHFYTLLTLARLRLHAEAQSGLPSPSWGWVEVSELCRMLEIPEAQLNVEVYRIRRDFRDAGLDATALIERRKASRQLRLGPIEVSVETLR